MSLPEKCAERISGWISERVESSGASGVVLGLSGGLDSSVAGVLCKRALGNNALALLMPCHSGPEDLEHALLLCRKFGIKSRTINLSGSHDKVLGSLPKGDRTSLANIKPRLRMLTLYYFANLKNYLVVGTGNKSELMLGYFTKYGDGASDLLPLGDLYKTQVRELAGELGVPDGIIGRKPSAGLWPGQSDEKELGMPYEELDRILQALEGGNSSGLDPEKLKGVREMVENSRHKREVPPVCRL